MIPWPLVSGAGLLLEDGSNYCFEDLGVSWGVLVLFFDQLRVSEALDC